MNVQPHIPVMLSEVLTALKPIDGKLYVDATFGNGGYTQAFLQWADCRVIAIDRDPSVQKRATEFKSLYGDRFDFVLGTFGDICNLIDVPVDGIVFDIGVSSMQLDQNERGFSYAKEAPLDMRMSQSGVSAKDLVNTLSESELANLIYHYGEERKSRSIARHIVNYRQVKPIETTTELAELIYRILPPRPRQTNPATRTFQALRIAVNDELKQLESGLTGALDVISFGGKIVVVSFHSLEDRIVKNFFATHVAPKVHKSRYAKDDADDNANYPLAFVSKAILPTQKECLQNSRAHSAKLRYAIKRKE